MTNRAILILGAVLILPRPIFAQAPLADTQRGFPPNTGIATSGLDHVNLFNGNLAITIPIGPEYPIGPGLSSQLRLVYNSQIWRTEPVCSDLNNNEYSGVFVRGTPVLGAGWRLDFGYIHTEPESGASDFLSPDGAAHRLAPSPSPPHTTDTTFLRQPQLNELDFPNGDRAFLNQTILTAQVAHGSTTHDFNDANGTYVTRIQNRYGDYVLVTFQSDYEVSDGGRIRIRDIKHYRRNIAFSTDELVRTITFHYQTLTVNPGGSPSNTWTVMSGIDLPTAAGTQHVIFDYHVSGFFRPTSDNTATTCVQGGSQSLVAAPLLKSIQLDLTLPALKYAFEYLTDFASASNARTGAMREMTLPTGGVVGYQWPVPSGNGPIAAPSSGCQVGQPTCDVGFRRKNVVALSQRTEYPDGVTGQANSWTYDYQRATSAPYNEVTAVTAPDNRTVRHFFATYPDSLDSYKPSNGLEYQVEHLDGTVITRRTRFCFEDDIGHTDVCDLANFSPLSGNIRQSFTDVTTMNSSGSAVQTRRIERSGWDGYGHFGTEDVYEWDSTALPRRSTTTIWNANSADWILEMLDKRTVSEGGVSVRKYFEFDRTNGFLKGEVTWDSTLSRILGNCRYPEKPAGEPGLPYGNLFRQFTATVEPIISEDGLGTICPDTFPINDTVGKNSDAFGKQHEYQNGALTSSRWLVNDAPIGWYAFRQNRDSNSGMVTSSFDTAGVETRYSYDMLGRVTEVRYPTSSETTTAIAYDSAPTQTTITRSGGAGLATWERQIYDGFGRLVREIRQLPTPAGSPLPSPYAVRVHRYDEVGRKSFDSEWAGCSGDASCALTSIAFGTTTSNFDPFGRPQSIVAADGATTAISYSDVTGNGTAAFSDTRKLVTVNNINGACGTGSCQPGLSATTTYRYDVFGRLVSAMDPNGVDITSYTYDSNDKLRTVTQGAQIRTFAFDALGFLRSETAPEKGTVTFGKIGSLENVREKTEGGGALVSALYDAAGRLSCQAAGTLPIDATCTTPGLTLLVKNCYDGGAGCPGGTFPGGKLTQRVGYNPQSPGQNTVTESFTYSNAAGRLSTKTTTVSGVPLGFGTVTETWTYNLLGLISSHTLPKLSTDATVTATTQYSNGIPVGLSVTGGPTLVSNVGYHPHGGLASWQAGNNITTTISADPALLPRPANISSSSGGFNTGTYSYDGAGNITKINPDTFAYDDRSRLTASTVSGISLGYQYDRFGNLNYLTVDQTNNRLKAGRYDARGNLTSLAGQQYEYDILSRQVSLNGGYERYLYGGEGERIGRTTASAAGSKFFTITPCRLLDTRTAAPNPPNPPPNSPVPIDPAIPRIVQVTGNCAIPADASAVAGNLIAVTPPGQGLLQLYPTGTATETSALNYRAGLTRANNFNIGLSGAGQLSLATSPGATHAIVDVTGYYAFSAPINWTLTFRDESNRLSTDFTIGTSISRSKNYFYFGNLLVATRDSGGNYLYYSSDHLGTPRLVTNTQNPPQVVENHKYQPFGQEIGGSFGTQPLKFAAMERDTSSGKDYVHARFLSSIEGRFLSPDKVINTRRALPNPQSWNRYAYVLSNPLKYVDPTGKDLELTGTEDQRRRALAILRNTVPVGLRMFVRTTTTNGKTVLDPRYLNMMKSSLSGNFQALRTIANSPGTVRFDSSATSVESKTGSESIGANGLAAGITLPAGLSLSGNIEAYVGGDMNARESAETGAHELRHARQLLLGLPYRDEWTTTITQTPGAISFQYRLDPNGSVNIETRSSEREAAANYDPFLPPDE